MNASLAAFLAGMQELRSNVEGIRLQNQLFGVAINQPPSETEAIVSSLKAMWGLGVFKRRFDYNSTVISLYGLLEHFVESLVAAYSARLNSLAPSYGVLPDALRESHIEVSFALLSQIGSGRYKGAATREELIANLHSCLSSTSPYRLNHDAFTLHTSNLRVEVVESMCGRLGIQNVGQRLKHFPPFDSYLVEAFAGQDVEALEKTEIFSVLADLAQRRNEVAHGEPGTLLSNEILLDYIRYVECFGSALHQLVHCDSLSYEAEHKGVSLGSAIAVYDHRIVCLELKNVGIKVGDILIAKCPNNARPYVGGPILEIQIERVAVERVSPAASVKVGACVEFHAKENQEFYVVSV